eukprot:5218868-Ditylum_brightwellii.AAC.1
MHATGSTKGMSVPDGLCNKNNNQPLTPVNRCQQDTSQQETYLFNAPCWYPLKYSRTHSSTFSTKNVKALGCALQINPWCKTTKTHQH